MAKQLTGARMRRGFTLVEVLVVITIVSFLATIAYPTYMNQMRRANRADAREALTLLSNEMERFFASNRTYTTDLSNFSMPTEDEVTHSKSGHYVITAEAGNTGNITSSYLLTAVPVEDDIQSGDDDCLEMSVSSAGEYLPSPATSDCW